MLKRTGMVVLGGLALLFFLFVKVSFPPPDADCIFLDKKYYQKTPSTTTFVSLPEQGSIIELYTCERTGMHRAEIQRGMALYLLIIR